MAWRGRGRRPPGGFSRHDITLKDDDSSDVPQNFPPVNNMPARAPAMEQMDPETQRLLSRYNKMRLAFHESPFHMDKEAQAAHDGTQPAVQTFVDVQQDAKKQQTKSKAALHQVVYMHKTYMPQELYTAKQARASMKRQHRSAFSTARPPRGSADGMSLDATQLEQQAGQQTGQTDTAQQQQEQGEAKDKDSDEDEEDQALHEEEDEDDEFDREDDDYYQGEHFDDDEEYGQDDDDGDHEAYF